MQFREFASDTSEWRGHNGSTDDAHAIPVFSALPLSSGTLPLLDSDVHLSPSLPKSVEALRGFFEGANEQIHRQSPDSLRTNSLTWSDTVLATKTLGAVPGHL